MPRAARVVVPGLPHHVTQTANNREDLFLSDDDRRAYLEFLRAESHRHGLEVLGYCLMHDHVHVIAMPKTERSLATGLGRAHWKYAQWFNRWHGRCGHLWQGRFQSVAMDEAHFWAALAHVERNPVRSGLAARAWEWPWSSAAAHVGKAESPVIDRARWEKLCGRLDWQAVLLRGEEDPRTRAVQRNTRTGRPLGDEAFVTRLEKRMGRRLHALPVGRPRAPRG